MKLTGDCPHCKKPISYDVDKLEMKKEEKEIVNPQASGQATKQILKEPEIIEKEVIKTVAPKDQPFFKCKNCGDAHENPNYSEKPNKKCKNCDSLNGSTTCKNCGNKDPEEFEELDDEELKDLGIPDPKPESHSHEEE